mmetsp:Transcript_32976/g.78260  ORF Transcript_32976/g.78260 Transcript_32976/m.78260 type:complete len:298 (-) Transcript_32976:90-983(-)
MFVRLSAMRIRKKRAERCTPRGPDGRFLGPPPALLEPFSPAFAPSAIAPGGCFPAPLPCSGVSGPLSTSTVTSSASALGGDGAGSSVEADAACCGSAASSLRPPLLTAYLAASWKYSGNPTTDCRLAKLGRSSGPGTRPSRRPSSALCIATTLTPSSDIGYATSLKPMASSSSGGRMGVLPPPSSMLAIFGLEAAAPPRRQKASSSSRLWSASMKSTSAPAAANSSALASASSRDTACRASVRAMMTMSAPSSLASAAAAMRATASALSTTCFAPTWPQLLGHTWSSMRIPAKPAAA